MGNICSSSANKDKDAFSTPGRPLGASSTPATTNNTRASVPSKVTTTPSSPGRTLGSSDGAGRPEDARSAAARAAEERATAATKPGGKLKTQLDAQKRKTQGQMLNEGSNQERMVRTADENAKVRNWD